MNFTRRQPSRKTRQTAFSTYGLVLFALVTVAHGIYRVFIAQPATSFEYSDERTALGIVADQQVDNFSRTATHTLSDVESGYCRYVVVASSSCSFSKRLAVQWTVIGLQEQDRTLLPHDWQAFWVFVEAGPVAAEFSDSQFPVPRYRATHNSSFMNGLGITGFPYHLVLDRDGRIVEAGTGGSLHKRDAYRGDCSVRND